MTILRARDGKFYDVPDDQAKKFEVAPDKVKETLAKLGPGPGPEAGPHNAPGGPISVPNRGGGPVVIQVFPSGGPGPSGHAAPGGGGDDHVDPYWYYYYYWWRNFY
jgi:hypothetical protein